MTFRDKAVAAMHPQTPPEASSASAPSRSAVRSGYAIMPDVPKPARNNSFIFGHSASRMRPLLNQEERDRLHCWSMVVALASSAAGTALLITAMLP